MNTLSTIVASLNARLARLRDAAVARLAALKNTVLILLADAGRHVSSRAAKARLASGIAFAQVRDHARFAAAVGADLVRPARERIVALLPPVRRGVALGAAQGIGVGIFKLALVVIAADLLLGLLPWRSRAALRRDLRGSVAAGLLGIAFAGATLGHAIDPRRATTDVDPVSAASATSPVVVAPGPAVAPGQEDLVPAHPAGRRTRRRAVGTNDRA